MGGPGGFRVFTICFDLFFFFLMRICLNTEIKDPVDRGTERESSIPKRSKRDNELQ